MGEELTSRKNRTAPKIQPALSGVVDEVGPTPATMHGKSLPVRPDTPSEAPFNDGRQSFGVVTGNVTSEPARLAATDRLAIASSF